MAIKNDLGKLRWDLLPMEQVEKVVEVLTKGAEKYTANNWQNLEDGRKIFCCINAPYCCMEKG